MRHFSDALIEEFEPSSSQTFVEGKLGDVLNKLKRPKKTKQVSIWEDDPLLYDYEGREGSAKCSACGKTFNLKELYAKIHNGSGKWECPNCKGYLEIPNQLEIFSSKFVQCPDCFNIYIKKDYTNVDNPGTCECGGNLEYLITKLGRDIPAIKDFALAECEHCHTKIPMKDLVVNAKKANGKVECQNCPSTKIKIPSRCKSKFYSCKLCGTLSFKASTKNNDCQHCPGTLEDCK